MPSPGGFLCRLQAATVESRHSSSICILIACPETVSQLQTRGKKSLLQRIRCNHLFLAMQTMIMHVVQSFSAAFVLAGLISTLDPPAFPQQVQGLRPRLRGLSPTLPHHSSPFPTEPDSLKSLAVARRSPPAQRGPVGIISRVH